jgi:hypothetical protein
MTVPDEHLSFRAALCSVLASDLPELEVVVVQNGVTERHAVDVQDSRVVRVGMRPGQRAMRLRNVGIARARAPYVALLNPEDLLKPNKLSATVSALDRNPEAGFAFSDFECTDDSGRVIEPSKIGDFEDFRTVANEVLDRNWHLIRQASLARGLLYQNFIGTSGVVMRRHLLSEIGPFDEGAGCCADLDFWFRLAHRCDALYWSEVGYSHRSAGEGGTLRTRAERSGCIGVLRRERVRWHDRAARRQLDRAIARYLACIADEERRRRFRSAALFAAAFATSPDVRWLRGLLRSILS